MSKPALLVLTSTFPRWADDHEPPFVFELSRRLTEAFEVTVLAPHAPGARRREQLSGVHVERFRYAPGPLQRLAYQGGIPANLRQRPWLLALVPFFLLAQGFSAWRLVRRLRPAVIHAHWLIPQGLIASVVRYLGHSNARLVITAHGADVYGFNATLPRWLKRRAIRSADAVTVVSRALARDIRTLYPERAKIKVAPMGVDLEQCFIPGPHHAPHRTLVYAGRLVEKKGVDVLLRAMPRLLAFDPACRLVIAGTGPLLQRLQAQASELGIRHCVTFTGEYRNRDLPALLRASTVAVYPFRRAAGGDQEGLGLVVVEAMGCERPVVVGDVPGVHDVVEHEVSGLIVAPDDPTALSGAVIRLLRDAAMSARLASAGRHSAVARFGWRAVTRRYATILSGTTDDQDPRDASAVPRT